MVATSPTHDTKHRKDNTMKQEEFWQTFIKWSIIYQWKDWTQRKLYTNEKPPASLITRHECHHAPAIYPVVCILTRNLDVCIRMHLVLPDQLPSIVCELTIEDFYTFFLLGQQKINKFSNPERYMAIYKFCLFKKHCQICISFFSNLYTLMIVLI